MDQGYKPITWHEEIARYPDLSERFKVWYLQVLVYRTSTEGGRPAFQRLHSHKTLMKDQFFNLSSQSRTDLLGPNSWQILTPCTHSVSRYAEVGGWKREYLVYYLAQHPFTICVHFLQKLSIFTTPALNGLIKVAISFSLWIGILAGPKLEKLSEVIVQNWSLFAKLVIYLIISSKVRSLFGLRNVRNMFVYI